MKRTDIQNKIDTIIAGTPTITKAELKAQLATWLNLNNQDLRILEDLDSYSGVQELN